MFRKRRPETDVEKSSRKPRNRNHRGRKLGLPHRTEPGRRQRAGPPVPDQREAVVLKIYQGFKFEEMAEILSCPVSTIKSRLYTALELLKIELAPIEGTRCVMSCSPFDLKDYFLKELPDPPSGARWKPTSRNCQPAAKSWTGCVSPEAALFALRDEEIPQRIAFVSDQVFEPSPLAALVGRVLGIHGAPGLRLGGHAFLPSLGRHAGPARQIVMKGDRRAAAAGAPSRRKSNK
jgi:hypothetical protein